MDTQNSPPPPQTSDALTRRVEALEAALAAALQRLDAPCAETTPDRAYDPETRLLDLYPCGGRYLRVQLDQRALGLPLAAVVEIVRVAKIHPVPHTFTALEGVLDLRGTPVSVIDLRVALGLQPLRDDLDAHIVILRLADARYGFKVDAVSSVPTLQTSPQPRPHGWSGGDFVLGIDHSASGLTLLLDAQHLLESIRDSSSSSSPPLLPPEVSPP